MGKYKNSTNSAPYFAFQQHLIFLICEFPYDWLAEPLVNQVFFFYTAKYKNLKFTILRMTPYTPIHIYTRPKH